jgi:putative hydroxymethylpyrimidine transport system substrate-binding protein
MQMLKQIVVFFTMMFICFAVHAKTLTVLLDWYANPDHAPLFVAQEFGFFKQNGLDVKLISPTDPGDPIKLMAAGKADIAVTYQPTLLVAVDAGVPAIRVGTLIKSPLNAVAVLQSSNIKNISDLKGKRIGYATDGSAHAMLSTLLVKGGLTDNDVEMINVHYGLTQALMSGKVDAITGIMRNFESLEMAAHGHPARMFNYEDYGIPPYDELILATRRNLLHDPRLPAFLTALTQATHYLMQHPEDTWNTFAKHHPELNNQFNHDAWLATLPYFSLAPAMLDRDRYQHFAIYWQQHGVIKTVPILSDYAVDLSGGVFTVTSH